MRRVVVPIVSLLILTGGFAWAPALAAGEPAATTQPAVTGPMALWFAQLADTDEEVREQARISLMGMEREELGALRQLVEESMPLAPSQLAALKEIVLHVFLTGESYPAAREQGFLGIRGTFAGETEAGRLGMLVVETMPGFCGYRMLRSGDVIMRVAEYPNIAIRDALQLKAAIQRDAGKQVHLEVFRGGQIVRIPVTVDAWPAETENEQQINELLHERSVKAEEYWQNVFAPLLRESVSTGDYRFPIEETVFQWAIGNEKSAILPPIHGLKRIRLV